MAAEHYEIRVRGRVGETIASSFKGLEVEVRPVETVLHGEVADQEELHRLIDRVQALGLELVEVRRVVADGS
jgi:malate/lactate dehydrogenase